MSSKKKDLHDFNAEVESSKEEEKNPLSMEILSADVQKTVLNRLSRVIGHLQSIKRMVETAREIEPMLVQISAVRSAVNGVGREMLGELVLVRNFKKKTSEFAANDVDEILTLFNRYLK
ncbi:MAG: metal-sensing transcriptional repressor [Thermoguttaceae bacterium]|jgi:DNA-binding FrmR family transcriptional regulator